MDQQKLWDRIKEGLEEAIVGMDPNYLLELAPKKIELLLVCLSDLRDKGGKWTEKIWQQS